MEGLKLDKNTRAIEIYQKSESISSIDNFFILINTKEAPFISKEKTVLQKKLNIDFTKESANFTKSRLLNRSGSFYLSQRDIEYQNVIRLLE